MRKLFGYIKAYKKELFRVVEDIEKIRKHLRIDKWVVSGGSWGSTLALAYAQKHPGNIRKETI